MTTERINKIFLTLGITKKDLGLEIGMTTTSVSQFLRGGRRIPDDIAVTLEGLADDCVNLGGSCERDSDKVCDGCGACMPW